MSTVQAKIEEAFTTYKNHSLPNDIRDAFLCGVSWMNTNRIIEPMSVGAVVAQMIADNHSNPPRDEDK